MRAVVPLRSRQGTEHSSLRGQAYIDDTQPHGNETGFKLLDVMRGRSQ